MMLLILLFNLWITPIQDIPYKSDSEFSIRLDLVFKPRPTANPSKVEFSETNSEYQKRTNPDPLPYMVLYVSIKDSNQNEQRMRIFRDGKSISGNRKFELMKEIKLDVGYTDDAKDKISGFEHIIYFLTADKKEVSKIVITIAENGDYFVNGQKRGRV